MALELISLHTDKARATLSPYGAQVMSFVPAGHKDVLWQTSESFLETARANTKPLRGGVPLCWPWFRGHPTLASAPSHGIGRLMTWQLESVENTPLIATARLALELDGSDPAFPHPVRGEVVVTLTDALKVEVVTHNVGADPIQITQALHTYLRVGEIEQVMVDGLAGVPRKYISLWQDQEPHDGAFAIRAEAEHLYRPVHGAIQVMDQANNRVLVVENGGCEEAVVWNPWNEKVKKLDMPESAFHHMLCVEAANAEQMAEILPGASYTLSTTLRIKA